MSSDLKAGSEHQHPTPNSDSEARVGAFIICPVFKSKTGAPLEAKRSIDARLGEARGLALAIDLEVREAVPVNLNELRPATLFGTGKIDELAGRIRLERSDLVIVDCTLSPIQQRNLEKAWNTKVIDRTGLILEIFSHRARTKEGKLQVDLAHLTYQKSRLVRSWTHLERQRGGLGFVGGPGETQIEADRRMIQTRISAIEKQLEKVRRTRALHRAGRRRVPYPMIALVGYTNAGKSTLFNTLTQANVAAKDQLFDTLDPTMRELELPGGQKIILSDTVGFISDLPAHLIAAFRATLEEVLEADIILHVRDIAHEDADAQSQDVHQVLDQLDVKTGPDAPILEIWNKADLLSQEATENLSNRAARQDDAVLISAQSGAGLTAMLELIEARLNVGVKTISVKIGVERIGEVLSWLHRNARDVTSDIADQGWGTLTASMSDQTLARFKRAFPDETIRAA